MKYFLDTEFIEDGKTIDLISIGIVAEDGREFYAVNRNCNIGRASGWVEMNVLNPMGIYSLDDWLANPGDPSVSPRLRETLAAMRTHSKIGHEVIEFIYASDQSPDPMPTPEFWGYYADYDWVVFCQLFGTMMDLPKAFPMYCRDIKQLCDSVGDPKLPEQGKGEHNALDDARWNKAAWEYLIGEAYT